MEPIVIIIKMDDFFNTLKSKYGDSIEFKWYNYYVDFTDEGDDIYGSDNVGANCIECDKKLHQINISSKFTFDSKEIIRSENLLSLDMMKYGSYVDERTSRQIKVVIEDNFNIQSNLINDENYFLDSIYCNSMVYEKFEQNESSDSQVVYLIYDNRNNY